MVSFFGDRIKPRPPEEWDPGTLSHPKGGGNLSEPLGWRAVSIRLERIGVSPALPNDIYGVRVCA
jgi:hypothetical protein